MVKATDRERPITRSLARGGVRLSESLPLSKDASTNKGDYISALPDEILLRILEYLPDIVHPTSKFTVTDLEGGAIRPRRPILDYASVALTCRSLNRAATTMMYRKYDHCYDTEPSTRFIRSLITSPALGALVKEMKEVGQVSVGDEHMSSRIRSFQDIQMICSKIESLGIPNEEYATLLRKGEDAFSALESALILWLTPNIETVALNCCPGAARAEGENRSWVQRQPQTALLPIFSASLGIPYGRVHQFTRLKRLSIRMLGLHINWLAPILRLDSLREVVLSDHDYLEPSLDDPPFTWGCPPKRSKVEKIRLENFECDLALLENLLGSCKALTSFSWGSSTHATGNTQWQWSEAKALLETLQPGLQALELCERREYSDTRLGTLQKFASLRYLAVPFELLISPLDKPEERSLDKLLPMGLETLVLSKGWDSCGGRGVFDLRYERPQCDPHVQSLLDACQSGSIRLQKFGIIMYVLGENHDVSETEIDAHFNFHEYAIQCRQCGIHFDFVIKVRTCGDVLPAFIEAWSTANEEIANEYKQHLYCPDGWVSNSWQPCGHQLQGISKPAFFDTYDDAYDLDHRTSVLKERDDD